MKAASRKAKTIVALVSAALASGCAGGGGGDSGWSNPPPPPPKSESSQKNTTTSGCGSGGFDTLIFGAFCGPSYPLTDSSPDWCSPLAVDLFGICNNKAGILPPERVSLFTNWQDIPLAGKAAAYDTRVSLSGGWSSEAVVVERDASGALRSFNPGTAFTMQGSLASLGQPAMLTSGATVGQVAVVANPYDLGWNYQSFGVWNESNVVKASSFGAPTPGSAVPATGTATFTGKLAGFYTSVTGERSVAAADVRVSANFSARSLDFASSGTSLTGDLQKASAAPTLNLSGTLTYQRNNSAFSGTLTSAGGTLSGATAGSFNGPAAQELGGAFALKSKTSAESFAGAYGAKR